MNFPGTYPVVRTPMGRRDEDEIATAGEGPSINKSCLSVCSLHAVDSRGTAQLQHRGIA